MDRGDQGARSAPEHPAVARHMQYLEPAFAGSWLSEEPNHEVCAEAAAGTAAAASESAARAGAIRRVERNMVASRGSGLLCGSNLDHPAPGA